MKQHITEEQLNDLPEDKLIKITRWMSEHGYADECPDIGQMIEFLDEHTDLSETRDWVKTGAKEILWWENEELCDALWEAVKAVL